MLLCVRIISLIARFMGPTWGLTGADRTQVGPMLHYVLPVHTIMLPVPSIHYVLYPSIIYIFALCVSRPHIILCCRCHPCIEHYVSLCVCIKYLYVINSVLALYNMYRYVLAYCINPLYQGRGGFADSSIRSRTRVTFRMQVIPNFDVPLLCVAYLHETSRPVANPFRSILLSGPMPIKLTHATITRHCSGIVTTILHDHRGS